MKNMSHLQKAEHNCGRRCRYTNKPYIPDNENILAAKKIAKKNLNICIKEKDYEKAHSIADETLLQFIEALGHKDIVKLFRKVNKWYS